MLGTIEYEKIILGNGFSVKWRYYMARHLCCVTSMYEEGEIVGFSVGNLLKVSRGSAR